MHMDVAAVVVAVRVGTDKCLMAGEVVFAKLFTQLLRPVNGQAVVRPVAGIKGNDVVMAFHIFLFLIFPVAEVCPHTGNSEILVPAVEGGNAVVLPLDQVSPLVKNGLHGALVMLKGKVLLGGSIVRVFRADMLERRQSRHQPFAEVHISNRAVPRWPPAHRRTVPGRERRTRSGSVRSGLSCCRSFRIRRSASRWRKAARH